MQLLDPLFRWRALDEIFSDRARVQRMLDFEAALARAEARVEVIPRAASVAIEKKCRAELIDISLLAGAVALFLVFMHPLVSSFNAHDAHGGGGSGHFASWLTISQKRSGPDF